jgi:hypothetical protein
MSLRKRAGSTAITSYFGPTGKENEMSETTQNQIRRLMAERDLLLSAIAPEDYAKIEPQMKAISESPDEEATNG